MKRFFLAAVVLALVSRPFHAPLSRGSSAPPQAVVRVYPDWRADPRAYVTLAVPLEGLEVRADAVRRAAARGPTGNSTEPAGGAIIVVTPDDQQDRAVVDAMGGLVYAQLLGQGSLALRTGNAPTGQQKPCLFLDILGEPLAHAQVEVMIGQDDQVPSIARPRVWIADMQLDAEGRLQPPRSTSALGRFTYNVVHPDCGPVPAMPQYAAADGPDQVFKVAALPKDQWCVFVDALGYPMAGVRVEPVTGGSWENGRMTFLDPILLDGQGRLRPPQVFPTLARCSFVVSDPNYGTALVEPYSMTGISPHEPLSVCVVPLAAYGTPADAGSIWGTVIDSDGTPVPGAVIACRSIVVPRGEPLRPYWPWPAQWNKEIKALTNSYGQFAMCMPLADVNDTLGSPVPVGSAYEVTITPPAELGYLPFGGRLTAGMEHAITLEGTPTGPKKYTGTLAFEDERGPVTDPAKIIQVNLVIQARRRNFPVVTYGYHAGEWLEKSALPFGRYDATADWDGKHYTFRPVMVTAESPEIIVFRPWKIVPFEIRYRGRVIHGTSGDPIAGAIVLPSSALGAQGLDPNTFSRLAQQASWRTVRTDQAGRFEIALPIVTQPGPEHTITAIKEGYLGFEQQRSFIGSQPEGARLRGTEFPLDQDGRVVLPDMKLFPAGIATIEPNVPGDYRGKRILLDFLVAPKDTTSWLKDAQAPPERNSGGCIIWPRELTARRRQSLYIPAYITLTLRVQLLDERYAPALIEDVLVGQGKTIDLGHIDFVRGIPVMVKVVDSTDKALEGILVKCLTDKGLCSGPEAVTDSAGVARVRVATRSSGRFAVEYEEPRTRKTIREETPYEVAGAEDAGREFILQLSDEFLERLLRPR